VDGGIPDGIKLTPKGPASLNRDEIDLGPSWVDTKAHGVASVPPDIEFQDCGIV